MKTFTLHIRSTVLKVITGVASHIVDIHSRHRVKTNKPSESRKPMVFHRAPMKNKSAINMCVCVETRMGVAMVHEWTIWMARKR